MKRVKETLAVLFLSLVLGSCGSLMDNNILLSIHKGMTQEEVTKLLGRPDYRRFDGIRRAMGIQERRRNRTLWNHYPD